MSKSEEKSVVLFVPGDGKGKEGIKLKKDETIRTDIKGHGFKFNLDQSRDYSIVQVFLSHGQDADFSGLAKPTVYRKYSVPSTFTPTNRCWQISLLIVIILLCAWLIFLGYCLKALVDAYHHRYNGFW